MAENSSKTTRLHKKRERVIMRDLLQVTILNIYQSVSISSSSSSPAPAALLSAACLAIASKNGRIPKPASSGNPSPTTKLPTKPVWSARSSALTCVWNGALSTTRRSASGLGGIGRSDGRVGKMARSVLGEAELKSGVRALAERTSLSARSGAPAGTPPAPAPPEGSPATSWRKASNCSGVGCPRRRSPTLPVLLDAPAVDVDAAGWP